MDDTDCMACNWQEATETCELVEAHTTPVSAQGYKSYTSKLNIGTERERERAEEEEDKKRRKTKKKR